MPFKYAEQLLLCITLLLMGIVLFFGFIGMMYVVSCAGSVEQLQHDIKYHTAYKNNPKLEKHNFELGCGLPNLTIKNPLYNEQFGIIVFIGAGVIDLGILGMYALEIKRRKKNIPKRIPVDRIGRLL